MHRLEVVQRLASGAIQQRQAAAELRLSVQQAERALRAYRQDGAAGLVSGRRGKPGNQRRDPAVLAEASSRCANFYSSLPPTT